MTYEYREKHKTETFILLYWLVGSVMDVANISLGGISIMGMHEYYELRRIDGRYTLVDKKTGKPVGTENEEKDK